MDVAKTLGFFQDVLGMQVSPFPGRTKLDTSGWILDHDGNALIHVNHGSEVYPTDAKAPWSPAKGGGSVHHVALNCAGYAATRERLKSLNLEFVENDVSQINLRQLFVREPNGIFIELNFRNGA